MLDYIIQVLLFQTLFLAVYDLILKRETFFQWNRAYLILTSLIAYIIPLVKFENVQKIVPQEYVVLLPEVILSPTTTIKQNLNWSSILFTTLQYIFWIGIIFAAVLFIIKLYRILQLVSNNEKENKGNYSLVFLENNTAFSFFNYIFLGKTTAQQNKEQIIEHELVHVQQKHSLDLILFELQRIVFWFNPFSYIYQRRVSELHEFIADSKAIKKDDKKTYFNNLLAQTFGIQNISFINLFFKHSLIKKRIVMLGKNKSKQFLKLKYLLLAPILVSMLIYTSCEKEQEDIVKMNKNDKRVITIYYGGIGKLEKKEFKSNKEGYFDIYMLGAKPEGKEIDYQDLSTDEKLEFNNQDFNKGMFKGNHITRKIFEDKNGIKSIMQIFDFKKYFENKRANNYENSDEVPFAVIDKAPTFPSCEDAVDQKKCFEESISNHISQNFDTSIANSLGLNSGKKKVYVQFRITKEGSVSDVRARAPHESLEDEAVNVVYDLPDMKPGEHNGKKVNVTYTLPISFVVK